MGLVKPAGRFLYNALSKMVLSPLLYWEWKHRPHPRPNERPVELAFACKWLARLYPENVLDVGSGKTAWPHLIANCGFRVTAIDDVGSYWKGGCFNRHYHVIRDDITRTRLDGEFDLVTCLSTLEHIPDHRQAVSNMFRLLAPGGHLLLSFPYAEESYIENVYEHPASSVEQAPPFVCQVYSRGQISKWLEADPGEIVDQEYYEVFTGEHWTFGERQPVPRVVPRDERHQLTCLVIRKKGQARR